MLTAKNPPALMLARFEDPGSLLKAAAAMQKEGYTKYDAHSPFPIHGMDQAMGMGRSPIGYIVGVMGTLGLIGALTLQWWTSAVDYPLVISGKPFFSYQAFVPVTFALTVLLSAFGAFFGMLGINQLPQLYHTIFHSKTFERVSTDGFFISIDTRDPKYSEATSRNLLESIGGKDIEVVTS